MVNIALSNNVHFGGGPLFQDVVLQIAEETIDIKPLKITAGFPFGEFIMPKTKFKCVKEKIINGQWEEGAKSSISSSYIKASSFDTKFNVPAKKNQIIEADCEIKHEGKDIVYTPPQFVGTTILKTKSINLHDLLVNQFGFNINNLLSLIAFDASIQRAVFNLTGNSQIITEDFNALFENLELKHLFYDIDRYDNGNVVPIEFDTIKEIINTLRWLVLNLSPGLVSINDNIINVSNKVQLFDPINFHEGNPIKLDTEKIITWKESTSKMGFAIGEEKDENNFIIKPIGIGTNYKFEDIGSISIFRFDKIFPLAPHLYSSAVALATYYNETFGDKLLEISTIETTPIVPYNKIQIDNKTYYCIETEIPYPDYKLFKYKLQEII